MLIALVGASGSGKSRIESEIARLSNFEKLISYTTRDPRPGEIDGIDYHFISNEEFLKNQGNFAEFEEYSKNRFYGTLKNQYKTNHDFIAVLTPHGVRQLKKSLPELKMFVVLVQAPLCDRVKRYVDRLGWKFNEADLEELNARVNRDWGMFRGFEDESDMIVNNPNGVSAEHIAISILSNLENGRD